MARFCVLSIIFTLCVLGNAIVLPRDCKNGTKSDLKPLLTDPIRKWSANTTISFPSSDAFKEATERWTIANPPTYVAAIRPGTEEDISKVVSAIF